MPRPVKVRRRRVVGALEALAVSIRRIPPPSTGFAYGARTTCLSAGVVPSPAPEERNAVETLLEPARRIPVVSDADVELQ